MAIAAPPSPAEHVSVGSPSHRSLSAGSVAGRPRPTQFPPSTGLRGRSPRTRLLADRRRQPSASSRRRRACTPCRPRRRPSAPRRWAAAAVTATAARPRRRPLSPAPVGGDRGRPPSSTTAAPPADDVARGPSPLRPHCDGRPRPLLPTPATVARHRCGRSPPAPVAGPLLLLRGLAAIGWGGGGQPDARRRRPAPTARARAPPGAGGATARPRKAVAT